MAEFDNENDSLVTHILTLDKMLIEGLILANFSKQQIQRRSKKTNLSQFNSKFGTSRAVACTIYEDLQTTTAEDTSVQPHQSMRVDGSHTNLRWLLRSMMYLRKYLLADDFEAISNDC